MSSVRYESVEKKFGALTVLRALDLEVPDHAFLALLGPSGCGKTTALRLLAGLDLPTAGRILIGDRNVWSSIVFAFCNVIEAVVVALLIERYFGSSFELNQLRRVIGFISAAIIGCCVSGIGGTIGLAPWLRINLS